MTELRLSKSMEYLAFLTIDIESVALMQRIDSNLKIAQNILSLISGVTSSSRFSSSIKLEILSFFPIPTMSRNTLDHRARNFESYCSRYSICLKNRLLMTLSIQPSFCNQAFLLCTLNAAWRNKDTVIRDLLRAACWEILAFR